MADDDFDPTFGAGGDDNGTTTYNYDYNYSGGGGGDGTGGGQYDYGNYDPNSAPYDPSQPYKYTYAGQDDDDDDDFDYDASSDANSLLPDGFYGNVRRKGDTETDVSLTELNTDTADPTTDLTLSPTHSVSSPKNRFGASGSPRNRPAPASELEPGVPLESDPSITPEMRLLREHVMLREVHWNDFYKLATRCCVRFRVQKGVLLAKQGNSKFGGKHYCVISKGLVNVERNGMLLETLKVGDSFGEQQLLFSQPAAATLVTASYVEAWGIERDLWMRIKGAYEVDRRGRRRR